MCKSIQSEPKGVMTMLKRCCVVMLLLAVPFAALRMRSKSAFANQADDLTEEWKFPAAKEYNGK